MAVYIQKKYPKSDKYKRVRVKGKYYDMVREKDNLTRAKRDPKSGRLMGRYSNVPPFAADSSKYLVLNREFDFNKDKKPDLFKGQIIARLKNDIKYKPKYIIIKIDAAKFKRKK